jgi:hypothetical protein
LGTPRVGDADTDAAEGDAAAEDREDAGADADSEPLQPVVASRAAAIATAEVPRATRRITGSG